jgi:hypothetical protein
MVTASRPWVAVLPLAVLALSACSKREPELPDEVRQTRAAPAPPLPKGTPTPAAAAASVDAKRGQETPMAERVATLGLLNKRNNLTRDLTLKPGESLQIDNVIVKLAACERTAPWEDPPETGAFVQVFVEQRATVRERLRWYKVFSGWLFKNAPSLTVVEHPVYDVWVKDCAMSFPGEEASPAAAASSSKAAKPARKAPPSPRPSASPTAAPPPVVAPSAGASPRPA